MFYVLICETLEIIVGVCSFSHDFTLQVENGSHVCKYLSVYTLCYDRNSICYQLYLSDQMFLYLSAKGATTAKQ